MRQKPPDQAKIPWPIILALFLLVLTGLALFFIPASLPVIILYDGLHIHWWWPGLILLIAVCFQKSSRIAYEALGLPQFAPRWASGLIIVSLLLAIFLLNETAIDLPIGWSLVQWIVLVVAIYIMMPGLIGYSELWRSRANAAVIRTLAEQQFSQQFVQRLEADKGKHEWGSKHKLVALRGFYAETKTQAARALLTESNPTVALSRCLIAGENLHYYLCLRWHPDLLPADQQVEERSELTLQLVTLHLIAQHRQKSHAHHQGSAQAIAILPSNPYRNRFVQTVANLQQWRKSFGNQHDPFGELLNLIFTLGEHTGQIKSPAEIKEVITQVRTLFDQLPFTTHLSDQPRQSSQRAMALTTWLALAHHILPDQACFDVWLALSKSQADDPLLTAVNFHDPEPVAIDAALFLANFYDRWSNQTPQFWNPGLKARATYVKRQIDQFKQQITVTPRSEG